MPERSAAAVAHGSGHVPAANQSVQEATRVAEEPPALAEGQIPSEGGLEYVRPIVTGNGLGFSEIVRVLNTLAAATVGNIVDVSQVLRECVSEIGEEAFRHALR